MPCRRICALACRTCAHSACACTRPPPLLQRCTQLSATRCTSAGCSAAARCLRRLLLLRVHGLLRYLTVRSAQHVTAHCLLACRGGKPPLQLCTASHALTPLAAASASGLRSRAATSGQPCASTMAAGAARHADGSVAQQPAWMLQVAIPHVSGFTGSCACCSAEHCGVAA